MVLVPSETVTHQDVMGVYQMAGPVGDGDPGPLTLREARAQFEREYILDRLTANGGNLGETARDLGLDRSSLYLKLKQLGIRPPTRKAIAR